MTLRDFHAEEDRLPASQEVSAHFGWASQTSAINHLQSLGRKGVIEYREDQANRRAWWRFTRTE